MGRNQNAKGGGCAMDKGTQPGAGLKGSNKPKAAGAATALGLGVPQQNTVPSGLAGLGMAHRTPLDSFFGCGGTNLLAGIAGLSFQEY